MTLQTRFILIYGVGSAFFLIIFAFLVFNRLETSMVIQLQQQFEADARSKLAGLQQDFSKTTERFRSSAKIPIFRTMRFDQLTLNDAAWRNDVRQLELHFLELQQSHPEIWTIRYLDPKGFEILRVEKSSIAQDLADLSQEHDIRKALELTRGEVSVTVSRNENNEVSELIWWIPVYPSHKVSTGVLGFHISFDSLRDRVMSTGKWNKEHVRLEDGEGGILFSTGGEEPYGSSSDTKWNASDTLGLPGLPWKVIISADPASFLTDVNRLRWQVFLIILPVIILLSLATIILTSRRITGNIRKLVKATGMIGSGNLDYRIDVKANDEIGRLAVSFNQMVERLNNSEKKSRAWLENSPTCTKIVDLDFNLKYMSSAGIRAHKIDDITQFYGKPYPLDFYPELFRNTMTKSLEKAKETGGIIKQEASVVDIEGNELWFHSTLVPVSDNEGQIDYIIIVSTDTTERRKMEEDLIKKQKLESVAVLAGGIAHDFNNSLQGILSSIAMAKLYVNPEEEVYKILTDAERVTMQSKGLSQQLLTFSSGGDPIRQTIFITQLIKDSVNLALSGSNVRCELGIPDDLWPVEADKGQLDQVISNLIINADQAMPEGGNIKVWAENISVAEKDLLPIEEGKYVKINIEDHGAGISHEHLQKVFDPYFTTREDGNGLGLATTYSIIKKHDGYINVESKIGIGTIFYIYLPASRIGVLQEPGLDKAKVESAEEAPVTCKGKILLTDDENVIRLVIAQHMRNLEYEVETAEDGAEAIRLYKRAIESGKPFDAVVMDLTMPGGMGGKEATEKIIEVNPKTKVIVSSGYVNDPIMAEFKKHGFKAVLTKPYEIDELDEVLQRVIMENET